MDQPAPLGPGSSPRQPHLCIVSHNYAPEPTGIPYFNTGMAEWFVRRGWRVSVLTGIPHYPWWRIPEAYASRDHSHGRGDETIAGVEVLRVPHFVPAPPCGAVARMRLDASWIAAWWRRIPSLRMRPDVVVGVAPPFLIGALLLRLRRRWRVPVVCHVQDLQVDAALDLGMLPRWAAGPLLAAEAWQLAQMDMVAACGRGMLPRLAAKCRLRRPPQHWPNWVDTGAMRPWSDADGANPERALLHGGGKDVRVLYSGSLGRKQGLETLVGAAARLQGRGDVALTIAGAGSELSQLAEAVSGLPGVGLQELRPAGCLRAFLTAADIHIVPQRREAADLVLPSKLLNIMAAGRPVVATAAAGTELADIVGSSGAGVVVPPGDADALAAAIARLADDADARSRMGAAGRAWVEAHAGADAVLARRESELLALAGGPSDRLHP